MPLPSNRPIRTTDAVSFVKPGVGSLHKTLEAMHLLGMSPGGWTALMKDSKRRDPALLQPTLAVLLRWMAKHPRATMPALASASPVELRRILVEAGEAITMRDLAIALGAEESAGSRWHRQNDYSPAIRRACALLIAPDTPGETVRRWNAWVQCARLEMRVRRLGNDVCEISTWYPAGLVTVPLPRGSAGQRRNRAVRRAARRTARRSAAAA